LFHAKLVLIAFFTRTAVLLPVAFVGNSYVTLLIVSIPEKLLSNPFEGKA
jgi:hypothetical protein